MELKSENPVQVAPNNTAFGRTALEIVTGNRKHGQLIRRRIAGHAFLPVGTDIYEIKLMMFPRHTYYMRQSRDSIYRYTVYAKRFLENEQTKLLNPIGYGRLCSDLKNFVEIYFPLLGRLVFVDLIPRN